MKELVHKIFCIYCKDEIKGEVTLENTQWHTDCTLAIDQYDPGIYKHIEIEEEITRLESINFPSLNAFTGRTLKHLLFFNYDLTLIKKYLNETSLITQICIFHVLVIKKEPTLYNILLEKLEEHKGKKIKYHYQWSCFSDQILANNYLYSLSKELLTEEQDQYIIDKYLKEESYFPMFLFENTDKFIHRSLGI